MMKAFLLRKAFFIQLVLGLTGVLLISSCGSIKPIAPDLEVLSMQVPEQPYSTITVPVKVNLKPYFEETDSVVPKVFKGEEQVCEGVSFKYLFLRDPINFEGEGEEIKFSVDGKYSLWLNYCPNCNGWFSTEPVCVIPRIYASCGVDEPMRKVFVEYSSNIKVSKEYKLESKTTLKEVKAKSPCKITVFSYNATELLEEELFTALQEIEKDIDKEIGAVDLRPDMEYTWDALNEYVDLEGYGYFYINPESVMISDISYVGDTAYFNTVLKAKPFVSLQKIDSIKKRPLPDLQEFEESDGFDVYMDILAPYDSLSSILNRDMAGMETEVKGKKVVFDSVFVYGSTNNQISFRVKFSGKKRGEMYFTGTPIFDSLEQVISFPDLTFDLKTKSALLKSAKWMFDKKITNLIRDYAEVDLKPHLDSLKVTVDSSLNGEITEGVNMKGKVEHLGVKIVVPQEHQLFVRMKTLGRIEVNM